MDSLALLLIGGIAALSFLAWAGRIWVKATLDRSVQAKFEGALEGVRSDLRLKEGQIAALQSSALSGRAGRQALLDKRRIEAIESLWNAALRLDVFKMAATTFSLLKLDAVSARAPVEPRLQMVLEGMKGTGSRDTLAEIGGESERLFVPEDVWAIFSAYKTVLGFCWMRIDALAKGIENTNELFADQKVIDLVKAVLPSHVAFLDQHGITGIAYTVDTLQLKLLDALRNALEGNAADEQTVEQTKRIIKLTGEADAALANEVGPA